MFRDALMAILAWKPVSRRSVSPGIQEVKDTIFSSSHVKFHTVVKGCQTLKSPHAIFRVNLNFVYFSPP